MAEYATGIGFVKDFVSRTRENYMSLRDTKYDVTNLINSAIGMLIVPKESQFIKISNKFVDETLLEKMKNCVELNTYDKPLNLSQLVRHLRNGISHNNMEFDAQKSPMNNAPLVIKTITIEDHNKNNTKKFRISLTVDLLKEFFMKFSEAVIQYCDNHQN